MKITKRFILGLFSSLLLAAGFARAADRFDPMSNSLPTTADGSIMRASMDCNSDCWADLGDR